ncbi:MAG: hypothetical protein AAF391_08055 [Bacteroidota bacterium]
MENYKITLHPFDEYMIALTKLLNTASGGHENVKEIGLVPVNESLPFTGYYTVQREGELLKVDLRHSVLCAIGGLVDATTATDYKATGIRVVFHAHEYSFKEAQVAIHWTHKDLEPNTTEASAMLLNVTIIPNF